MLAWHDRLVAGIAFVSGFYALGVAGARSVGGDLDAARLRRAFVHSLVPIALVYVAAHYLTFLLFEGQSIAYLASDPLGEGWDLFGTASATIDYGALSQTQAWYLQVGVRRPGPRGRADPGARPRPVALSRVAARRAIAILDAGGDGGIHHAGAVAACRGTGMRRALALGLAAALCAGGCGDSSEETGRSDRLVDFSKRPPFVNSLERDRRPASSS